MNPAELPIRDLHLPDAIGIWPLAPGWWIVIALTVVALIWLVRRLVLRRARGAMRRHALRRLAALEREYLEHRDAVKFATALSALVRRTMLAYAPRQEVAGLTGESWLEWLDHDLATPCFLDGDGRALVTMPYRGPAQQIDQSQIAMLVDAVRLRLKTPVTATRPGETT